MISTIKAAWRLIPSKARMRFWETLNKVNARDPCSDFENFRPSTDIPPDSAPLVVAGIFRSASGIGAAARSTFHALRASSLNPVAVDITELFTRVDYDPSITLSDLPRMSQGTLILHINAPETPAALKHLGYLRGKRWRVIGYWAWELPVFPKGWDLSLRYVSELWTLSEFSASSFRQHDSAPKVKSFPIAINVPDDAVLASNQIRKENKIFTVLTMADALSSFSRKNPAGAVRAFRTAFGNDPTRRLIVKTRNLDASTDAQAVLSEAIGDAKNIEVIDGALPEKDHLALLASVDALISLHRAEGFGMPLAEGMAFGLPIVATGWSGNMSFMTSENSLPVKYSLVQAADPFGLYDGFGSLWAEPDENDAAEKLRALAADPSLCLRVGALARQSMLSMCSYSAVGHSMANALRGAD